MDIKEMTDSELVEVVAREVMGFDLIEVDGLECWYREKDESSKIFGRNFSPLLDMNDLFMVLEKFEEWSISHDETETGNRCLIYREMEYVILADVCSDTLPRAVLEAALSAERGKG